MSRSRPAFTVIELLVVVAIVGILTAILLPTLGSARESSRSAVCAANLKSQGAALRAFLNDSDERLPQVWIDPAAAIPEPVAPSVGASHIGQLYAGVTGDLPFLGINTIGVERRPLNAYLGLNNPPSDESQQGLHGDEKFFMSVMHCPADQGVYDGLFELKQFAKELADARDSAYELLGASYVLNDHALDPLAASPQAPEIPTLVPLFENNVRPRDGRMPEVRTPALTWVIGDQPIYNYNQGGDRKALWHFSNSKKISANLLFVDLHVGTRLPVPAPDLSDPDVRRFQNTTENYSFLPEPEWPIEPPTQP